MIVFRDQQKELITSKSNTKGIPSQLPFPPVLSIAIKQAPWPYLLPIQAIDSTNQPRHPDAVAQCRPHTKGQLHPQRLASDSPTALLIGVSYLHALTGAFLALPLCKKGRLTCQTGLLSAVLLTSSLCLLKCEEG